MCHENNYMSEAKGVFWLTEFQIQNNKVIFLTGFSKVNVFLIAITYLHY